MRPLHILNQFSLSLFLPLSLSLSLSLLSSLSFSLSLSQASGCWTRRPSGSPSIHHVGMLQHLLFASACFTWFRISSTIWCLKSWSPTGIYCKTTSERYFGFDYLFLMLFKWLLLVDQQLRVFHFLWYEMLSREGQAMNFTFVHPDPLAAPLSHCMCLFILIMYLSLAMLYCFCACYMNGWINNNNNNNECTWLSGNTPPRIFFEKIMQCIMRLSCKSSLNVSLYLSQKGVNSVVGNMINGLVSHSFLSIYFIKFRNHLIWP